MYEPGVARYTELVRTALNIKGPSPFAVEGLVVPTLEVGHGAPDYYFARRELLAQGGVTEPAVAAQFGHVCLQEATGGLRVFVIERFWARQSSASWIRFNVGPASGVTLAVNARTGLRDNSWAPQGPVAQLEAGTAAAVFPAANYAEVWMPTDGLMVEGPWVLREGQSFNVGSTIVNAEFRVSLFWRERAREVNGF